MCGDMDSCPFFRHLRKSDELAATGYYLFLQRIGYIYFIGNNHPDIPIYTAIIIEVHLILRLSRRSQRIMFSRNTDCQYIITVPVDMIRQISHKSHITAMMFRYLFSIQINITVCHNSLKRNNDSFILICFRELKITAIPTDTVIYRVSSAMLCFQLHDMRQDDGHPAGIIQIHPAAVTYIAPEESPVSVHIQYLTAGRGSVTAISRKQTGKQEKGIEYVCVFHVFKSFQYIFDTKEGIYQK